MTRVFWTPEDRAVLVADLKTARATGVRVDIVDVFKAMLQYHGGYRQSDLTGLTEDLAADFVPAFETGIYEYALAATNLEASVTLTATLAGATILYYPGTEDEDEVASGVGKPIALEIGANVIPIRVHLAGYGTVNYTITVTRAAE